MSTTTEPRTTTGDAARDDDARCVACAETFAPVDGWLGLCPSCGALLDEHESGRHDVRGGGAPVGACVGCLATVGLHGRGRLTA